MFAPRPFGPCAPLCFALLVCTATAQTTYYVDDHTCPSPGSGTVGNPYGSIQARINAASGGGAVGDCVVTGCAAAHVFRRGAFTGNQFGPSFPKEPGHSTNFAFNRRRIQSTPAQTTFLRKEQSSC